MSPCIPRTALSLPLSLLLALMFVVSIGSPVLARESSWERGNALYTAKKYKEAAAAFTEALDEAPEFAESFDLRHSLMLAHYAAKNWDGAMKAANEAKGLAEKQGLADLKEIPRVRTMCSFQVSKPNWDEAHKLVEALATKDGKPELLRALGAAARKKNATDAALKAFEAYLTKKPDDDDLRKSLGGMYIKEKKDFAKAASHFQVLHERNPQDFDTISLLAQAANAQKDCGKLLEWADKGLALKADDQRLLSMAGTCAFKTKKWAAARKYYEKLNQLKPSFEFASAIAQSHDQQGSLAAAVTAYRKALELKDDCQTKGRLANAIERQGTAVDASKRLATYEEAERAWEQAAACGDKDAAAGIQRCKERIERIKLEEE